MCLTTFKNNHGIDPMSNDKMAMQRLKEAAEKARSALLDPGDHDQPALHHRHPRGPLHMEQRLTQGGLGERMTSDLVERLRTPSTRRSPTGRPRPRRA